MDEIVKEHSLLKELVKTLEKENESRNKERSILGQELDRLAIENDELMKKYENSRIHERENQKLKRVISQLEAKIYELEHRRIEKVPQSITNNEDLQRKLREREEALSGIQNQHSLEVQDMSQKILRQSKIIEEQEKELEKYIAEVKDLKGGIYKMELSIEEKSSKIRHLQQEKIQINTKIKTLEVQMGNHKIEAMKWKEMYNRHSEQDSTANYEEQIKRNNALISYLKENQDQLEEQIKQKSQIIYEKDEVIQNLTKELKYYSDVLQQKEQDQNLENSKREHFLATFSLQKEELLTKIQKLEHEKNIISVTNNHEQKTEINKVKQENYRLNDMIAKLKKDNDQMKRSVQYKEEKQQRKSRKSRQIDDLDLRDMIRDLRSELVEVKLSNKKMGDENEKMQHMISQHIIGKEGGFHKVSPRSEILYPNEESIHEHRKKPTNRYNHYPKIQTEKEENPISQHPSYLGTRVGGSSLLPHEKKTSSDANREKWESLQRKINMLREQNDELKKTLFE